MVFEFLHPVLRQYMILWFFRCDKGVLRSWFCDNHKRRWSVMGCVEASGICYNYGVLFHKAASLLWCTGTGFRHCNTWGMCPNHIRILISTLSFYFGQIFHCAFLLKLFIFSQTGVAYGFFKSSCFCFSPNRQKDPNRMYFLYCASFYESPQLWILFHKGIFMMRDMMNRMMMRQ